MLFKFQKISWSIRFSYELSFPQIFKCLKMTKSHFRSRSKNSILTTKIFWVCICYFRYSTYIEYNNLFAWNNQWELFLQIKIFLSHNFPPKREILRIQSHPRTNRKSKSPTIYPISCKKKTKSFRLDLIIFRLLSRKPATN